MPFTTTELTDAAPMIAAGKLYKRFGRAEVLKGVSLTIDKGEVIAVIGPSGSGKSTFLRCLNHLEVIDAGEIVIDGEQLANAMIAVVAIVEHQHHRAIFQTSLQGGRFPAIVAKREIWGNQSQQRMLLGWQRAR